MKLPRISEFALLAVVTVTWLPAFAQDKYLDVPESVVRKHPKGVQALRAGIFPELENIVSGSQVYEKCDRYRAEQQNLCIDAGHAVIDINNGSDVSGVDMSTRMRFVRDMVAAGATDVYLACMNDKGLLLHRSSSDTSFSNLAGAPWPEVQKCAVQAKAQVERERAEKLARIEHLKQQKADVFNQLAPDEGEEFERCITKDGRIREQDAQEMLSLEELQACVLPAKANAAKMREEQLRIRVAQAAYDACTKTAQYRLSKSTQDVNTGRLFLAASEADMASVKRLESVSGVVDLNTRESAAASLLDSQARLDMIFADYKKSGGTADSPEDVRPMADPCQAESDQLYGK